MKCIFFFRDTGISLQIQLYQLYSEIFVFLTYNFSVFLFLFFNPIDTIFVREGFVLPVAQFIVYVVQPLFYLHGDPSFRQSCVNLGIWNALKISLPVCPNVVEICSKGFLSLCYPKVAPEGGSQAGPQAGPDTAPKVGPAVAHPPIRPQTA
jgi:hypothetical protein